MAASTTMIANTKTVISNGPNSASLAKANAAAGPIQDYQGNMTAILLRFQTADALLKQVKTNTDSSDSTNLTNVNAVLAALEGTSSPTATTLTALKAIRTAGPNSASLAKAITPAGPIMDYQGNVNSIILEMQTAFIMLNTVKSVTDSSDATNLGLINDLLTALA